MPEDRKFIEFLLSLALRSPHASDCGRRQFLHSAGRLALGAGAVMGLGKLFGNPYALAAEAVTLPEITSIPERLKGKGVVRVTSYGGAFQEAQRKAYFEPFERLSGIKVIESEGPDVVKVKAMVDTKNVEWDVAEFDLADVINLKSKGDYWEEIDYSLVDTGNIDEAFSHKYALDMLPYGQVCAYRTDVFKGAKPDGWADFWDTKKFPGGRTMPAGTGGLVPDLEFCDHGGRRADGQSLSDRHRQGLRQPHEDQACRGQVVGGGRHPGTTSERQGNHDGHRMEWPHCGHPSKGRPRRDRLAPGCVAHRLLGRSEGSTEPRKRDEIHGVHHDAGAPGPPLAAYPLRVR